MKIGILTSGGDAPGMNNAIRALVRAGIYYGHEMIGVKKGYDGLIDGMFTEMEISSVGDILQKGGTILGTSRSSRFMTEEGISKAVSNIEEQEIGALVVIGGEGSMKGALELSKRGVLSMVLPGTIDNDMGYTDYTIGFDTAVNTVLDGISKIRDTSSSHDRATLIEVMGRRCGDIALYAGLAGGADSILIPELEVDLKQITSKLLEGRKRGKTHNIIIKAEGVETSNDEIAKEVYEKTGQEVNIVVLSYLQRGGTPTATDRLKGSLMAMEAVKDINNGKPSQAIGMDGNKVLSINLNEAVLVKKEADLGNMALIDMLSK